LKFGNKPQATSRKLVPVAADLRRYSRISNKNLATPLANQWIG
jgi:hypothetical protein